MLQGTNKRSTRTARPNLALPDRLQLVEAMKADHLEVVAMAVDSVLVVVLVVVVLVVVLATEALLHPAAGVRSSSTMSVILTLFLIALYELPLT